MLYPVLLYYYATWTTLSPDRLLDRGLWENDEKKKTKKKTCNQNNKSVQKDPCF